MALPLQTQPGVGAITALAYMLTMGDVSRFPRGKRVASYLGLIPCEHSSGGRQKLGAISKQGQSHAAHVAGGSGTNRGSFGPRVSPRVSAPLPLQTGSSGQSGGGAQVGHTTVLDATHAAAESGSRSYREQPAGGPVGTS